MKTITSRDNRHIKECLKLKKRKYRDISGLFVVEGLKIIEEAQAASNLKIRYIFAEESVALNYPLQDLGAEVFMVNSRLMEEISNTDTPQGLVAIVEKPVWDITAIKNNASLLVLLDGIADPGNMGTIIRTAWAFGAGGILLTNDCVDPFSPKVVRSTMGGIFNLPVFEDITISDINDLKESGFRLISSAVNVAASYYECDFTKPAIITIGNEAHGVSPELLKKSDVLVTIPINPCVDSLNAGIACGIILSEVWKQKTSQAYC